MTKRYWTMSRVIVTYSLARVFYAIVKAIIKGPGKYLCYILVGAIIIVLIP